MRITKIERLDPAPGWEFLVTNRPKPDGGALWFGVLVSTDATVTVIPKHGRFGAHAKPKTFESREALFGFWSPALERLAEMGRLIE